MRLKWNEYRHAFLHALKMTMLYGANGIGPRNVDLGLFQHLRERLCAEVVRAEVSNLVFNVSRPDPVRLGGPVRPRVRAVRHEPNNRLQQIYDKPV
jgi:hypothetical protein